MEFTLCDAAFRQTKEYKECVEEVRKAMVLCGKVASLEDEAIALEALSFATFKAMRIIRKRID